MSNVCSLENTIKKIDHMQEKMLLQDNKWMSIQNYKYLPTSQ